MTGGEVLVSCAVCPSTVQVEFVDCCDFCPPTPRCPLHAGALRRLHASFTAWAADTPDIDREAA